MGAAVILAEFVLSPGNTGLSRETFLMGFAGIPNTIVDDTSINSQGFTGDAVAVKKSPNTVRFLTLGGSSMFNRRMTLRLKERLHPLSPAPLEVVGAALRTHTTAATLVKYQLLSKYRPDAVLIYEGINDLWANHVAGHDFTADYSHLNPWYKRNACLDHSVVCRLIYNNWIHRRPPTVWRTSFAASPGAEVFQRNLVSLVQAVRTSGGTPILMTFAWTIPPNYSEASFRSRSLGYNNPTNYDSWPVELWGPAPYVREGLEAHNRIIRAVATAHQVLLIDQEALIGRDLYWFGDVCHLSEEGTARFIDNIATFLVDQGLLPMSSGRR